MKKVIILLAIAISVASCNKEQIQPTPTAPLSTEWVDDLEGTWYTIQGDPRLIFTHHANGFTDVAGYNEHWEMEESYNGSSIFDPDSNGYMSYALSIDTNYFSGVDFSSYMNKYYNIDGDTLKICETPDFALPYIFIRQ